MASALLPKSIQNSIWIMKLFELAAPCLLNNKARVHFGQFLNKAGGALRKKRLELAHIQNAVKLSLVE